MVAFFFPSSSFSLRRLFKPSAAAGRRLARFRFQRETSAANRNGRGGRPLVGERGKFQAGLHSRTHHTETRYLRKTGTKRPALCQPGAD